jgi:DNA modification methylase
MTDIENTIIFGDSEIILKELDEKVDLVVTSPPYFQMRNEMAYDNYKDYIKKMYRVFKGVYRVLEHRRIFAVNISDYIENGVKHSIPFDLHHLLDKKIGFNYIDDLIWVKPAGVGSRAGNVIKRPFPMYFTPDNLYEHILIFSKGS